jgi:hypothetical protein
MPDHLVYACYVSRLDELSGARGFPPHLREAIRGSEALADEPRHRAQLAYEAGGAARTSPNRPLLASKLRCWPLLDLRLPYVVQEYVRRACDTHQDGE